MNSAARAKYLSGAEIMFHVKHFGKIRPKNLTNALTPSGHKPVGSRGIFARSAKRPRRDRSRKPCYSTGPVSERDLLPVEGFVPWEVR
jgi:hypothetical protein